MSTLIDVLKANRIIPVVVLDDAQHAVPLARKLLEKGIGVMEVTFRTPAAKETIARIKKEVPEMVVGAGTILTMDELHRAIDLGVAFCVSPGLDPVLIREAQAKGMPFVPGIATATEIIQALSLNLNVLKFFPAETSGGIAHLKALMAAFGHCNLAIMPTGGIRENTADEWFKIKQVVCVGGSWMIAPMLSEIVKES